MLGQIHVSDMELIEKILKNIFKTFIFDIILFSHYSSKSVAPPQPLLEDVIIYSSHDYHIIKGLIQKNLV